MELKLSGAVILIQRWLPYTVTTTGLTAQLSQCFYHCIMDETIKLSVVSYVK